MPYLKLNNSKINYRYTIGTDNFIISEIVNSTCSYETPTVIRDSQTLDLYFGRNYPNREYHDELINSGVSLFLYKPSSLEKRILDADTYLDLDKFLEVEYMCFDLFPEESDAKSEIIYIDSYTGDKFIWDPSLKEYINIKNLPQNIYSEYKYESWYNRDTLRLCSNRIFSLSEKYKSGDDFYIPNPLEEELFNDIYQNTSSSLENSFEFYNYLSENVKIYTSDKLDETVILIPDGNSIPNSEFLKDISPAEKSYRINVILDDGTEVKDLLWLKKESIIKLINSKLENSRKITRCGEIKLIKIIQIVTSEFNNRLVFCHPRYDSKYFLDYKKGISLIQHISENPSYLDELLNEERTLAFSIKFPKFDNLRKDLIYSKNINGTDYLFGRYIGLPIPGKDKFILISFTDSSLGSVISEIGSDIVEDDNRINLDLSEFRTWSDIYEELEKNIFPRFHYNNKSLSNDCEEILIYSILGTVPSYGFSNIPELEIIQNQTITQDILSLETESLKRIEFYSKTTGPNDQNIKIKIEPINYYEDKYRITISRFNYSEVYDLNLYDTPDRDGVIESMDHIISRNSRLVRCKLFREKPDGTYWKEGDPFGKLPIGVWELKRALVENTNDPKMYWMALTHMTENNIKEDFLCIPEIEKFLKNEENYDDLGYFKEYKDILEYCKTKNCQALIGNLDFLVMDDPLNPMEKPINRVIYRKRFGGPDENPKYSYRVFWGGKFYDLNIKNDSPILLWENTFIYNYTKDYDNYLIYFFRDILLFGNYSRPPYYLFLRGILEGNYSISTNEIFYSSPVRNSFIAENHEKTFELKKTNYLVSDGQKYFYKTYQNHPGDGLYKTSILTKFALSKVSRAIENNKWNFLGKQTKGEIRNYIERILLKLTTTYNIYHNIYLSEFNFNPQSNSMNIRLSIYIRELIDKPISLDIELNYIY